ncbi:MAG TPA: EF-hand domain-containing protein [Pseudonocardiaceae bacterium]|jgi:Ca2+-binding EF-hand superfamily protein
MEVSELRREKLSVRFAQHDVDGDGFLEQSDYDALGRLLSDQLGASSEIREQIAAGFAEQWRLLCTHADIDADGRIGLDEYVAAMGGGIAADAAGLERAVLATSRAAIQAADANGDGFLDLADFARLGALLHVDDHVASFQALDVNGAGRLSYDEIIAAVRDFYTSDDPSSPGNLVFGRSAA